MSKIADKCCPFCSEMIKVTALKCRYCKAILYSPQQFTQKEDLESDDVRSSFVEQETIGHKLHPSGRHQLMVGAALGGLLLIFAVFYLIDASANQNTVGSSPGSLSPELSVPSAVRVSAEPTEVYVFVEVPESSFLHLRSGPGTDYESLAHLKRGIKLRQINVVYEDYGKEGPLWLMVVTPDGQEGWVHGDYVTSRL